MTVHILKANFSRGEVSPKVFSRIDVDFYQGGAATVRNFYNVLHGGLRRRSGTRYAGSVKDQTSKIKFVPFVFNSTGQAYILEFGHLYIRFWTNGGQLVDDSDDPVEVVSPYQSADVGSIQVAQTGDTMFIAHPSYSPRRLTRNSNTSWTLDAVPFVDGPYYPINDTSTTVTGSADLTEGSSVTLTFSSATPINHGDGFSADDVGRFVRVKGGGTGGKWTSLKITAVNSTTNVTATVQRIGGGASTNDDTTTGGTSTSATKSWRLGAFGTTPGFPACVAFFQGRLVWANTSDQPRTLFFSRSGLPYDYCPSNGDATVTAEHGFYPTILAGLVDEILWLVESTKLQVGTSSGVRTVGASDSTSALSSTNVAQLLEVNHGVNSVTPVQAGEVTIVAERFGKALKELYFSFEQNSLVGPSFSDLSEHLFRDGVVGLAYQQVPEGIIWALTSTGNVVGCTYDREQKVVGFHRHDFGGSSQAFVETMAVIPGSDRDQLWMCVRRTINGTLQKYVEVIDAPFEDQDQEDAFFVDCGLTYDGDATTTVSNLDHLEGEEVIMLADGAVLPPVTVLNGRITLPNKISASKVQVGLQMVSEAKLLRPPYQQRDGYVLGRRQKISSAITEVIRTAGLRVGIEDRGTNPLFLRKSSNLVGVAVPLGDGPYTTNGLPDSWENGGQVYYTTDTPLPAYIRSVLTALDVEGG